MSRLALMLGAGALLLAAACAGSPAEEAAITGSIPVTVTPSRPPPAPSPTHEVEVAVEVTGVSQIVSDLPTGAFDGTACLIASDDFMADLERALSLPPRLDLVGTYIERVGLYGYTCVWTLDARIGDVELFVGATEDPWSLVASFTEPITWIAPALGGEYATASVPPNCLTVWFRDDVIAAIVIDNAHEQPIPDCDAAERLLLEHVGDVIDIVPTLANRDIAVTGPIPANERLPRAS